MYIAAPKESAATARIARVVRARTFMLLLVGVLTLTACGGGGTDLYDRDATLDCLRGAGVRADTRKIDFVASTALAGALHAAFPGNEVTVSFGDTLEDAEQTQRAYQRFAPSRLRPNLHHVLKRDRNAVMRWGVSPTARHETAIRSCLSA